MAAASELKKHYMRVLLFLQGLLHRTAESSRRCRRRGSTCSIAPSTASTWSSSTMPRSCSATAAHHSRTGSKASTASSTSVTASWARSTTGTRVCASTTRRAATSAYRRRAPRIPTASRSIPSRDRRVAAGSSATSARIRCTAGTTMIARPSAEPPCRIEPGDGFILNFDEATIADMEFYLNNRTDRHQYEHMFPLLRRAISLKQEGKAGRGTVPGPAGPGDGQNHGCSAAGARRKENARIRRGIRRRPHRLVEAQEQDPPCPPVRRQQGSAHDRPGVRDASGAQSRERAHQRQHVQFPSSQPYSLPIPTSCASRARRR